MAKVALLLVLAFWIVIIIGLALIVPKAANDFAWTLCWGKYDTPACHERLEAEKALVYQRDLEKR